MRQGSVSLLPCFGLFLSPSLLPSIGPKRVIPTGDHHPCSRRGFYRYRSGTRGLGPLHGRLYRLLCNVYTKVIPGTLPSKRV